MSVPGVSASLPRALDLLPLELHPWYLHHFHLHGGGKSETADAIAWRISIETEPPDEFKQLGIELCEEIRFPPRTRWGKDAVNS